MILKFIKQKFGEIKFNGLKRRIPSIFIGESATCPCIYYYSISSSIGNSESIHWQNTETIDVPKFHTKYGVFIFAHGDSQSLECYYLTHDRNRKYIRNVTWENFIINNNLTYFHVCHGADILVKNKLIGAKFPSWVSYSGEIIVLRSSKFTELEIFTKEILEKTYKAALIATNPVEFQRLIKNINFEMKERIKNYDKVSNILIATLGNNMQHLTHSN